MPPKLDLRKRNDEEYVAPLQKTDKSEILPGAKEFLLVLKTKGVKIAPESTDIFDSKIFGN